ncbi:MAG: hypothetical protein IJY85_05555 [Ruminococcus sp.]|nr:hypothetical protein [Ruminococcus sp.]
MKKRFMSIATAVAITGAACPFAMYQTSADAENSFLFGDPNGDTEVNTNDAVVMLKNYAQYMVSGQNTLTDEQIQAADINSDGIVDTNDAVLVLKYYAASMLGSDVTWEELLDPSGTLDPDTGDTLTIVTYRSEEQIYADYWSELSGIPVNVQIVGNSSIDFAEELVTYLAEGNDADLLYTEGNEYDNMQLDDDSFTLPLSELGITESDCADLYTYSLQRGYNSDSTLKALPLYTCPGGFLYRADLAETYLGAASPEEMQTLIQDWDSFADTAQALSAASEGSVTMTPSISDIFLAQKYQQPWVDPATKRVLVTNEHLAFAEYYKSIRGTGYNPEIHQWLDDWANTGRNGEALGYFATDWSFSILATGTPEISWAVCQGPAPFYWGGSWMSVYAGTDNPNACKDFFETILFNAQTSAEAAMLYGAPSANRNANQIAMENGLGVYDCLNGQNALEVMLENVDKLDLPAYTKYDNAVCYIYLDVVTAYANGEYADLDTMCAVYYSETADLLAE